MTELNNDRIDALESHYGLMGHDQARLDSGLFAGAHRHLTDEAAFGRARKNGVAQTSTRGASGRSVQLLSRRGKMQTHE